MKDKYGVNKAALGIRYLLKYLENGRVENFNVVMDCLDEVKLWCLITFYSNNIDSLFDSVPDYVLKDIFEMKLGVTEKHSIRDLYGRGFASTSNLSYRDQFGIIRGCFAHGNFAFSDGMIYIKFEDEDYEASFDLLWLEKLVGTTLKSNKFDLKKGMSDVTVSCAVDPLFINNDNLREMVDANVVQFYKITSLTSNKQTMKESIRGLDIDSERVSFYDVIGIVQALTRTFQLYSYNSYEENIRQIKKNCLVIETYLHNKVKIDLLPLKISDEILNDDEFRNLDVFDKFYAMITKNKYEEANSYNFEMVSNLIEIFEQMKESSFKPLNLYILKDARDFLLKVYANIFFGQVRDENSYDVARKYGVECKYVYADKIYKEYLKILKRNYEELIKFSGPSSFLHKVAQNMRTYSKLLDDVMRGDATSDFTWKMRNSITHNQVEFTPLKVRFYTVGKRLKILKYSKSKKEWTKKVMVNNKPLWEMKTTREDLLNMLDELYEVNGIEVNVNISKYVRRSSYLK